jgi:cation diffusion facilitator family transporter
MGLMAVTLFGALINIFLASAKLAGGFFLRSSALLADGIHSFSDLITDGAVLVGVQAAQRPADDDHAFGHGRYETVSSLFVGVMLIAAGISIGTHAVRQILVLFHGGVLYPPGIEAAAIAGLAIVVKEVLFHITYRAGVARNSPAVVANAWHHRSDALSSIAATAGIAAAATLGDRWIIMDPLAALLVTVMILAVAGKILYQALRELTDAALSEAECDEILSIATAVKGVRDPHGLRTRRLGRTIAVEIHIRVDGETSVYDAHGIASTVEQDIRRRFGSHSSVITHIEPSYGAPKKENVP